ncbi:DNA-repair protein [Aspergillus affinis]|uniref:DNA-repair protein n=1 Tax=Aspergillus affinis TaxID=1070780 RepID=UPI0022FDB8BC|nr:DNA-repair protein [Aspergillus affinis]KAI9041417.1 DNA-repair protein [Aspergillus affinis]
MGQNHNVTSQFTRHDLSLLAQSSPKSPLRVIALIDYDSFYAQCESVRLGIPSDVPLGVQQWNAIIALNYPARRYGLARAISVKEGRSKCPNIILQHVPTWREGCDTWAYRPAATITPGTDKAALDPYRLESRKGLELVKRTLPHTPPQIVEKASVDEMFIDLSAQVHGIMLQRYSALLDVESLSVNEFLPLPRTSVSDWDADSVFGADTAHDHLDWDDMSLRIGSEIVHNLRREIYGQMKYTCSAGIAHNKMLAKLASAHKKPNHQTIILRRGTCEFLSAHKFPEIRGLGGILGAQVVETLKTDMISELLHVSLSQMKGAMGPEKGEWIFKIIRGEEQSEVNPRTHVQSMLSAKTFVPKIVSVEQATKWLRIFVADILGRLAELGAENHQVRPTIMTLNHLTEGRFGPTRSKQVTISRSTSITEKSLFNIAHDLLTKMVVEENSWPCRSLSLRITGFEKVSRHDSLISSYFTTKSAPPNLPSNTLADDPQKSRLTDDLPRNRGGVHLLPPESNSPSEEERTKSTLMNNQPLRGLGLELEPYLCPHCKMSIPPTGVLEHLDWHVALELSNADVSSE